MAQIDTVSLDISVVLGTTKMPIHQMLRMARGAIIELDATEDDEVQILANDMPVARGQVVRAGRTLTVARAEVGVVKNGVEVACAAMQQTLMRIVGRAEVGG